MIIEYCKLLERYKKSCETYQQVVDEIISEKMDLEKENESLKLNQTKKCLILLQNLLKTVKLAHIDI